ncbi:lachesin isoform X2 [Athalia rosae]|uniref:lachesin isoform X2 n=1 Tax=Athalia rosae TaxID=37344 RepID=UPI002034A709|nr:lachesin isoform X2 [Athalia rosae]
MLPKKMTIIRLILISCSVTFWLIFIPCVEGRQMRNLEFRGKLSSLHLPIATEELNNEQKDFPRFAEPIPNVTVTKGRDALLACVVENLRNYKVAWVSVDTQTILSIHHSVITQNSRISLSYNDHRSWYLQIKNVQEEDRGWYMCQVNTDPMRSRRGYLQVVVPPSIVDKETSTDMIVREASNVILNCKAVGYPEPYVMWRREDGKNINYNGETVEVVNGEVLHIAKISRLHMGAYLCIASNGIPPSTSKRIVLLVQFPPMLSIPNQLEAAYMGQDVTLECHTESFPASINYWTTERGDMIVSGEKYEAVSMENGYNQYMMLKIRNVSQKDFGSYRCVAKNSLGETDGFIKLDEIPAPSTTTTQVSPHVTSSIKKSGRNGKKPRQRPIDYEVEEWRDPDYDGDYTLVSQQTPGEICEDSGEAASPLRIKGIETIFLLFLTLTLQIFAARR